MARHPARLTESPPAVELERVALWVAGPPRVDLLVDLSWTVRTGEHWAVLGPNGAGKTSLLSIVGASRHPSAGTASVLGRATSAARICCISTAASQRPMRSAGRRSVIRRRSAAVRGGTCSGMSGSCVSRAKADFVTDPGNTTRPVIASIMTSPSE